MKATDLDSVVVRERVTVDKVDVSGEIPRLIETIILEDGKVVSIQRSECEEGA